MATTDALAEGRERPEFNAPNILWFFGAFTAAAASQAVIRSVHDSARGLWILLASLAFLAAFAVVAAGLLQAGWWIPGGVLVAMAVTFVAPAAVAFEQLIGVSRADLGPALVQEFDGGLFAIALAVAFAGLIAYGLVRFPFILAIVVVATFVAAQLFVPVFVSNPDPGAHATAFAIVGAALIALGLALDWAGDRPGAFWWHLVGLIALAVGLGYHAFRNSTWGWLIILAFGIVVLLLATVLVRGTFAVFGVAGYYAPIAHYLDEWFGNLGTAFALVALGLGLIALGIAARTYGGSWPALRRPAAPV